MLAAMLASAVGSASPPLPFRAVDMPVLFVCDHGSVKSLMAASRFDEAAARRGLRMRAVARGVNPDAAGAARVIAIGVDLSLHDGAARMPIVNWNDVPPASIDYPRARDDLARRIEALLDEWQQTGMKPQ